MWKTCLTAIALCLLMVNAALAAELKIAFVNMREVVAESEPVKKARAAMESKFKAERDKLEKQGSDLQKQRDALKNPASNQAREVTEQKRAEFIRKSQDLDQKMREYSARVEKEGMQFNNEMNDLVNKVAKDFAVKKGITYLLEGSALLYADPSMDVTKEFMEEVNRQWKENPPAASGGKKK